MNTSTDIINRLIGYAGHNMKCKLSLRMGATDCTCGCWTTIAEAQEFLEIESHGEAEIEIIEDDWTTQNGGQSRPYEESDDLWSIKWERDR